jgi:ATP-dependent Lon protease
MTAITRLCTGFVKLLFSHVETKSDIEPDEFIKYCLEPAKSMRTIIKKQLCVIAPQEFDLPGKRDVPNIDYKY